MQQHPLHSNDTSSLFPSSTLLNPLPPRTLPLHPSKPTPGPLTSFIPPPVGTFFSPHNAHTHNYSHSHSHTPSQIQNYRLPPITDLRFVPPDQRLPKLHKKEEKNDLLHNNNNAESQESEEKEAHVGENEKESKERESSESEEKEESESDQDSDSSGE